MFEKQFIDWIAGRGSASSSALIAIGDDACLLAKSDDATVVTTDTLCDQVHFDCKTHSLHRIGRKCLAVSISDILAMGARPEHALLTFFLPKSFDIDQAKQLFVGAESLAEEHGIEIVGGDTNRYEGPLIVGSTVLGNVTPERTWRVSGARVGDTILVTGELGGSILAKHLDFQPRTQWVQEVAAGFSIHAATDITDSLSLDLDYLLTCSQLGGELVSEKIPVSPAAVELSKQSGRKPLDHALTDGEDFELLLCTAPEVATELLLSYADVLTEIGTVVASPGITVSRDGRKTKLNPSGYIH